MASNGAKQSFTSGVMDPISQTNKGYATNRRKFGFLKNSPLAKFLPSAFGGKGSFPTPKSVFGPLDPSFTELAVCLAVYLAVGTVCFYFNLDDLKGKKTSPLLDALYFCVMTLTTVGYGDLEPNSTPVKLLVCVFVFLGMALMGLVMSKIGDYLAEKQEKMVVQAFSKQEKNGPSKVLEDIGMNKEMFKCLIAMGIMSVLMMVGTMFLYTIEDLDIIDSLFCVCTTVTTLGYGDKAFSTTGGRAFATVWMLSTTVGLGQFFLYVAEVFLEGKQRALVNKILSWNMTNPDLEIANDGIVGAPEYIISKLKEMGKINQEDISCAIEEFEELDVHKSGFLSSSDQVFAKKNSNKEVN